MINGFGLPSSLKVTTTRKSMNLEMKIFQYKKREEFKTLEIPDGIYKNKYSLISYSFSCVEFAQITCQLSQISFLFLDREENAIE